MARKRLRFADVIFFLVLIVGLIISIAGSIVNQFEAFTTQLYINYRIPTWVTYLLTISIIIGTIIVFQTLRSRNLKAIQEANYEKFKAIQIANIDYMTGIAFENYLQKLLIIQRYGVTLTKATGDFGVDLVAFRNGDKFAIQVKRQGGKVSRRAISDAVAGMKHYECTKAMVITNNYFTPSSITFARSTGCKLVDRDTLIKWIVGLKEKIN